MTGAHEPPGPITLNFSWRLPDNRWVRARYLADVIAYEPARDRWLCVLRALAAPLEDVPEPVAVPIRALAGSWVYIPTEGRNGQTLPLKLDTLRGKPRYFHAGDPRLPAV